MRGLRLLIAELEAGELVVSVRDFGGWREPDVAAVVGGRGREIMRAVSRDLVRDSGPEGTTVRFRLTVVPTTPDP